MQAICEKSYNLDTICHRLQVRVCLFSLSIVWLLETLAESKGRHQPGVAVWMHRCRTIACAANRPHSSYTFGPG